jgi:phenylpyruvate tautomerase PptA (4-oxalocrotonate tautomerase family)
MRAVSGLATGILAVSLAFGLAEPTPAQQHSGPPAAEQKPVPEPRLPTQPPGQEAEDAKPTMLKPEHSNTPGRVAEPVPGATPQTMPSTVSAENARSDDLPIIAHQFPLTNEQKQKIAASVSRATVTTEGAVKADITQVLPRGVELHDFPADASAAAPGVERYRYVKLNDRLLIVDPLFGTVVGEIAK